MNPSSESKRRGRPSAVDDPGILARDLLIKLCHDNGMTSRRLAAAFGMHPGSFRRIVRRVRGHDPRPDSPDAA